VADHAPDGGAPRPAPNDPAQVRQRRSRPRAVRNADGNPLALAR
jgi:hypothetical protein